MINHAKNYTDRLNNDLNVLCGYTDTELEGRFEFIRTVETNISNWFADVVRTEFGVDLFIANSGTLRTNQII